MIERLRALSTPSRYLIYVAGVLVVLFVVGRRRRGCCGRCRLAVRAGRDGPRRDL